VTVSGVSRISATGPYKGLSYYAERDAPFFFGREEMTEIIAANLLASRLTLVYGASGVGKSSLLRAGAAQHLRKLARENLAAGGSPGFVVVVFPADEEVDAGGSSSGRRDSWRNDPAAGIAAGIERSVAELGLDIEPVEGSLRFPELLETWSTLLDAEILLVLDQFEEYFLYHSEDGALAEDLPRALTDTSLPANVLISIREDAYARLDLFKGQIPFLYDNYLRVDHLTVDAARTAIIRPLDEWNRHLDDGVEAARVGGDFVEAVLAAVQTGSVVLGQSGRGMVEDGGSREARVETPFLQLVLQRLWDEESARGSHELHLATLEQLGGAERIVRTHLDAAMDALSEADKAIAARAFRQLVTPSGTKIAHLPSDLAELESLPAEELPRVLERLAEARILRPIAPPPGESQSRYEIFHDVLGPAILDWRSRYEHAEAQERLAEELAHQEAERRAAEEQVERERAAAKRFRAVAGAALVLAVVALGLTVWAVSKKREASTAQRHAEARDLITKATAALTSDPAAALIMSLRAAGQDPNDAEAASVLRQAALSSHLIAKLDAGRSPVLTGTFLGDGRTLATVRQNGKIDIWNVRTGRRVAKLGARRSVTAASVVDGRRLAVVHEADVTVWDLPTRRRVGLFAAAGTATLSPDGRQLALATSTGRGTAVRIASLASTSGPRREIAADGRPADAITFSPDGARLLKASGDGRATLWDVRTGRRLAAFRLPRRVVGKHGTSPAGVPENVAVLVAAIFSPDGRRIALGTTDGVVGIFDARSGALTDRPASPGIGLSSLAFAPDGRLALGSADGVVAIRGRDVTILRGHTDAITGIEFRGEEMVTTSSDETARVWVTRTGQLQETLLGHTDRTASAFFSRRGNLVATTADDGTVRVWRARPIEPRVALPRHGAEVGHATFSRDGRFVLTSSADGTATLASAADGTAVRTFGKPRPPTAGQRAFADQAYGGRPNDVLLICEPRAAVSPDGTRIIIGDAYSGGARLQRVSTGGEIRVLLTKRFYPGFAVFGIGPEQRWAAITASSPSLWLVDARTGLQQHFARAAATGHIAAFAGSVTDDGRYLATADFDTGSRRTTMRVWDTVTGRERHAWNNSGSFIRTVAIDRSGRRVAGGTWGGVVWVRSVIDGTLIAAIDTRFAIRALAFSPDGVYLATAGDAQSARIWNVNTGRPAVTLRGHTAGINSIKFSPDGRFIVTASDDGTVKVWGAYDPEAGRRSGALWAEFRRGRPGRALDASFDSSGRRIAVAASDGTSEIYACGACGAGKDLRAYAGSRAPLVP